MPNSTICTLDIEVFFLKKAILKQDLNFPKASYGFHQEMYKEPLIILNKSISLNS